MIQTNEEVISGVRSELSCALAAYLASDTRVIVSLDPASARWAWAPCDVERPLLDADTLRVAGRVARGIDCQRGRGHVREDDEHKSAKSVARLHRTA